MDCLICEYQVSAETIDEWTRDDDDDDDDDDATGYCNLGSLLVLCI